jgi:hypothetical protein
MLWCTGPLRILNNFYSKKKIKYKNRREPGVENVTLSVCEALKWTHIMCSLGRALREKNEGRGEKR